MMYCENCGRKSKEGHLYCAGCGSPLTNGNNTVPIETEPIGVSVDVTEEDASYAPYVGSDAVPLWHDESAPAAVREVSLPPLKKKKSKLPLIIAAVLVIAVGVMAIGVSVIVFAVRAVNTNKYDDLITAGNGYLRQLEYEDAVEVFIKAAAVQPKREEAYIGAAQAYIGLGKYENARDVLKTGVEKLKAPGVPFTALCDDLGVEYGYKSKKSVTETQVPDDLANENMVGTTVSFGTYPQTPVRDESLLAVLESLPLAADSSVQYANERYLRVFITTANPVRAANGYYANTAYWFKYEPIQWRVLAIRDGKALLLTENLLDAQAYNAEYKTVTWETCTVREWLNNEFLNAALNAEERSKVAIGVTVNENNPNHDTAGGVATRDRVFLLSWSEATNPAYGFSADHSLNDLLRRAQGTEYAKNRGLRMDAQSSVFGNGFWWLRSPGYSQYSAASVSHSGEMFSYGYYGNTTNGGIRPALWMSL